jgi:hypothetical protein
MPTIDPTDKSAIFHFVRFADEDCQDFLGKASPDRKNWKAVI